MMRNEIKDLRDMTDSREILESKNHPFIPMFIIIVTVMFFIGLIWTYFGEMDVVVTSVGVVNSSEKVSTMTSKVLGTVESIEYRAGERVKAGQVLFTLEKNDLELQLKAIEADLERSEQKLENLEKYKSSVLDNSNHFNKELSEEEDYYYRFVKYQMDKEKLNVDREREKYHIDTIVETNEAIQLINEHIQSIITERGLLQNKISDYVFKAPHDGHVQVISEINKGDLVQQGMKILAIIPEDQSELKVILSVQNHNIVDIQVGDEVKYHFLALPRKEYGEIRGIITQISRDAALNPQDGNSYYTVEATLDNKVLHGYESSEVEIKAGMMAEAYVITETQKILYYILEKIDLNP